MSENGDIYSTGKNFTLPPALTAWTNSTSDDKSTLPPRLVKNMSLHILFREYQMDNVISHKWELNLSDASRRDDWYGVFFACFKLSKF